MLHPAKTRKKSSSNKRSAQSPLVGAKARFSIPQLALLAGVLIAVGILFVFRSQAAVGDVVVPVGTAGVPVPTQGVYWGGTSSHDTNNTIAACPVSSSNNFQALECKVEWASAQLGVAATPSPYHSTMQHFYIGCTTTPDSELTLGGQIWASAHVPGRKVMEIMMSCGAWGSLGAGGGNTTQDTAIKSKVDLISNLGVPVLLSFHHEPENDACATGKNRNPDEYRAASRQFSADVRNEEAKVGRKTISIGWTLMNHSFKGSTLFTSCSDPNFTAALATAANWYPGDDAIDWINPDAYVRGSNTLAGTFKDMYAWAGSCPAVHPVTNYNCTPAKFVKPMGISETGVSAAQPLAGRVAIMDEWRTTLTTSFPRIKHVAWWSSVGPVQDNTVDSPVSDTAHSVLKAFARLELSPAIHDMKFNASTTPTPTPTPAATPTPTLTANPTPAVTPRPIFQPTPIPPVPAPTPVSNITLINPNAGATVQGFVMVEAKLNPTAVRASQSVVLLTDGVFVDRQPVRAGVSSYIFRWNTLSLSNGTHTVRVSIRNDNNTAIDTDAHDVNVRSSTCIGLWFFAPTAFCF